MPEEQVLVRSEPPRGQRFILLLLGIALGQAMLYGPSLIGQKILLPLDVLADKAMYIPQTPGIKLIEPRDVSLTDLVLQFEPSRRFAASELHAGRFPRWAPFHYGGAPFIWPKFSPFLLAQCLTESALVLPWSTLAVALVAGVGMYRFLRGVLSLGFWPSAICSWCYPLTGFFAVWQGFFTVLPVCWLPWMLVEVEKTVRGGSQLSAVRLGLLTCLVLISGQVDIAGQVLLTSGLYAVWRLFEIHRNPLLQKQARQTVAKLSMGWTLGFLLATPYLLPLLEYTHTGARMARRSAGEEERPPIGVEALPQVVLPNMYGSSRLPSLAIARGGMIQESSAAGYVGVVATLLAAPLAFCSRRHRNSNILWVLLSIFALSWCLNLPGFVQLLRLPGLNMMSHNRLVFVTGFALLALAATGLDMFSTGGVRWRPWMWFPLLLLAGLCAWCVYRSARLPEPLATQLAEIVSRGKVYSRMQDLAGVKRAQAWFVQYYSLAALWCGLGTIGWVLFRRGQLRVTWAMPVVGIALVGELLWFGFGRVTQSDPELYYPRVPVLEELAKANPPRIMGYGCLPASLSEICGLRDIRGDDAVDPARMVELVMTAVDPASTMPSYAVTMEASPKVDVNPAGALTLPPVLDMLGVRYLIFRGSPFPGLRPAFQSLDYWAIENPRALSRAFVPTRVEVLTNNAARLKRLASPEFKPQEVAYVEREVGLPPACHGSAEITNEIPTRVSILARMDTPGLLVLADNWDKGWRAYLNGKSVPILRTNHAVRGVVVPQGTCLVDFRYEPASFKWGMRLAGLSATIMLVWMGVASFQGRRVRVAHA